MGAGLRLEREMGVARLTLDRPEVGNAIDIPLARAFMEAAIALDEDDSVRCILLSGAGRLFCAGGDVAAFSGAADTLPAFLKEITAYLHSGVARLMRTAKPVVTAVNGPAAGAGIGLALLGDIVLAGASAHFTLAYTGLGLSPDGATTWLLPRLVGLRRAQEMCLTNRRISAEEALQIGLVTRVTPDEDLAAEATKVAETLAAGPTSALGATRRLLLESDANTLETQMELESRAIAVQARTADGREGVAAFVEKRKPIFGAGNS